MASFNPFDTIVDIPVGYGRRANGMIVRKQHKIKGKKAVKQAKKARRLIRELETKPSNLVDLAKSDESQ